MGCPEWGGPVRIKSVLILTQYTHTPRMKACREEKTERTLTKPHLNLNIEVFCLFLNLRSIAQDYMTFMGPCFEFLQEKSFFADKKKKKKKKLLLSHTDHSLPHIGTRSRNDELYLLYFKINERFFSVQ